MYIIYDNEEYKYQLSIRQGGITTHVYCSVLSGIDRFKIDHLETTRDLQGIRVFYESNISDVSRQNDSQIVLLKESLEPSIAQIDQKTFWLKVSLHQKAFVKNFRHILYTISESSRQRYKSEFTIHAAAVSLSDSDGAILILGDKGSGKTVTAYALCKYHNAELIGNDLVIIGRNKQGRQYLHGGTTRLTIRKHIMHKFFPDILSEQINDSPSISGGLDYENKIAIDPNLLNISVCTKKKYIALVARVNVHTLATANSVSNVFHKPTEALRLHENFGRYIRGQTTPLMLAADGTISGYFPSFDNSYLQGLRNQIISSLLNSSFFYIRANSPQECAIQIKNIFEKIGAST